MGFPRGTVSHSGELLPFVGSVFPLPNCHPNFISTPGEQRVLFQPPITASATSVLSVCEEREGFAGFEGITSSPASWMSFLNPFLKRSQLFRCFQEQLYPNHHQAFYKIHSPWIQPKRIKCSSGTSSVLDCLTVQENHLWAAHTKSCSGEALMGQWPSLSRPTFGIYGSKCQYKAEDDVLFS